MENNILRFNVKDGSKIPFEILRESQIPIEVVHRIKKSNMSKLYTIYKERLYEVTTYLYCGEFYDTQQIWHECWWKSGHNIELKIVN